MVLQVFLTKEYLAIAMEFAAGGDMFQYVKHRGGLEEVEARWFFQQLIIGMDYCHKMVRAFSTASWGRMPCGAKAELAILVALISRRRLQGGD